MDGTQQQKNYIPQDLTPVQMAKRYGVPTDRFSGAGQKVAILSLQPALSEAEITADLEKLGVENPPSITIVPVSSSKSGTQSGSPPRAAVNTNESHLDVEIIASLCPRADITIYNYYPEASGDWAALLDAATKDGNKVISISYGATESDESRDLEVYFRQAAMHHRATICASAGNDGSGGRNPNGEAAVGFPASSPHVVACGGTMVNTDNTEVVWNLEPQHGATGGGVSRIFKRPSWQTEAGIKIQSANPGGGSGRVIPDVAALSAPGDWTIYTNSGNTRLGEGGTSASAPFWAAFFTLVNQARAEAGKGPLGHVNPLLYQIGRGDFGIAFGDITLGNNKPSSDYPGYCAQRGFDACTGWGIPHGPVLFELLTNAD